LRTNSTPGAPQPGPVAIKVLPSISPVNGNLPTFTIAEIDPATADIVNYEVYFASASDGSWSEEYDYFAGYEEKSFTASSVEDLVAVFVKDRTVSKVASQNYIRYYEAGKKDYKGKNALFIAGSVWPVCG
jgi:sphingomyelin phosphodiesterase acid-like 3